MLLFQLLLCFKQFVYARARVMGVCQRGIMGVSCARDCGAGGKKTERFLKSDRRDPVQKYAITKIIAAVRSGDMRYRGKITRGPPKRFPPRTSTRAI